ncbi:MAG: FecR domain-containing protein [Spirochaetes bacterium]|nr:FecR domain-containing protein [Spirochaetota bacterium]
MDKAKLYYYYWDMLDNADRAAVEEYLRDPKHREEYEALAKSFSTISSILGTDRYRKKRIPLSAIRNAYQRKKAREDAFWSFVMFGAIIIVVAVITIASIYHFNVRGETTIASQYPRAVIGVVEDMVAVEDLIGTVSIVTNTGYRVGVRETVVTADGRAAVVIGDAAVLHLHEHTRMTLQKISTGGNAVSVTVEMPRGGLTVYSTAESSVPLRFRMRSVDLTARGNYRFTVNIINGEEKVTLIYGDVAKRR